MLKIRLGDRNSSAAFSRVIGVSKKAVGDMRPIFEEVVRPYVLEHMDQQFGTLGKHGGKAWKSLDSEPKYKAMKAALVGEALANKVLWWDSAGEVLRPALTKASDSNQVWVSERSRAFFGTGLPYASQLIEGGTGPFGESFPGRAIFAMSQSQRKELVTLIQRRIVAQIDRRGVSRSMMRDQL